MKMIQQGTLFLALILLGCTAKHSSTIQHSTAMQTQDQKAIQNLLEQYESALNAANTAAVLPLYTEEGVFMPSEAPSSIGTAQVKAAYDFVFSQIKLRIKFTIDEIEVSGDMAFARTISKGTTNILAAGITVAEENRELFVLQKVKGQWKIARYIFNKMKPANS